MPAVPKATTNGYVHPAINKIAPQLLVMAVPIDSLVPDPNNTRVHPEMNMETIRASLLKYGQVHPLLCRESTKVIIAGNGRWQAAKDLGWTKIAAHFVPFNEIDAAGLGIADNRSAELAKWDYDVVKRIQRLQLACGDQIVGWDDDYVNSISKMDDWEPMAQDESEEAVAARPVTVSIKMLLEQSKQLESCLAMIKSRRSSPKKMNDAQALMTLLDEWRG